MKSLVQVLEKRASSHGGKPAFHFLEGRKKEGKLLDFEMLAINSRLVGGYLQSISKPGDRVLLFYPPGMDYVTAFMGCLYAGVVAVPLS